MFCLDIGLAGESLPALCPVTMCTYTHHDFKDTTLGAQTLEVVHTLTLIQTH